MKIEKFTIRKERVSSFDIRQQTRKMNLIDTRDFYDIQEKKVSSKSESSDYELGKIVQKKRGAKILEVFLEESDAGIYLYEKLLLENGMFLFLRTCLQSMGSGEFEDTEKVVEVDGAEMQRAIIEEARDWPGVTDLSKENQKEEKKNHWALKVPIAYIFEELTETDARFREITDKDDQELAIPLYELQAEKEHKENMGWTFKYSDETGHYYTSSHLSSSCRATPPTLKNSECCLAKRLEEICTANKKPQTCKAHMNYMDYPWKEGGWNENEDIELFFQDIMEPLFIQGILFFKLKDRFRPLSFWNPSSWDLRSSYFSRITLEEKIEFVRRIAENYFKAWKGCDGTLDLNEIGNKNFFRYKIFSLISQLEKKDAFSLIKVEPFFHMI